MAHESYVSLEIAKLLKQAGFTWLCGSLYGLDVRYKGKSIDEDKEYSLKAAGKGKEIKYVDGGLVYNFNNTNDDSFGGYSRPTHAVAQRWLREVKKVDVLVEKRFCAYVYSLSNIDDNTNNVIPEMSVGYDTYEQALEAGIKKCLTLILEK